MRYTTRRIIAACLMFTVAVLPAYGAAPVQANPNNLLFQGVDASTGNAAAPYIDHSTGSVYTTTANASGVIAPTTASGVPYVVTESIKASYRASASDVLPAATATDITTLCGSATKTVRVNRVSITADASAASVIDFYLIKRTVADTGGATSSVPASQMDSNDPVPSATVVKYTVNPATLGAGLLVSADHYALPNITTPAFQELVWFEDFGTRNNETVVLRGTAQCLAVNLNGQTIPSGMNVYVNYGWTEE